MIALIKTVLSICKSHITHKTQNRNDLTIESLKYLRFLFISNNIISPSMQDHIS